ncbi:hypothetical protein BVX98_00335 [bacterium F11]|nr:hypothetical protein BVX98_00335 [bacterium F11]
MGGAFAIYRRWELTLFLILILFYVLFILMTLLVLRIIRLGLAVRRGIYSYDTKPWLFYFWNLHAFLCSTNLNLFYLNGLLPPILRRYFYQLLGTKMKGGSISVAGRIMDPYLVDIQGPARIEDDALLMPHGYAVGSSDLLILDQISLGKGVYIGARSTLMPGVVVGENSMIKPMSIVPMNTKIPPNEIWGGNPACKTADVDQPYQEAI